MKNLMMIAIAVIAFAACKNDKGVDTVKTKEVTRTDTVDGQVRTRTAVSSTVKTDSTEATITTGKVEVKDAE
ncbi:MAG: hypothetical protein EOO45_20665 [Flavobacterium sp.]|nr:MAG: hypothetical protein EOO45_20665 [Flavobacterium sp.]